MMAIWKGVFPAVTTKMTPEGTIEITKLRVTGIGRIEPLTHVAPAVAKSPATPREVRDVWIDAAAGWQPAAVYDGSALQPGHAIDGPAIVDEQTTTLLVGCGDNLIVDASGNYRIALTR